MKAMVSDKPGLDNLSMRQLPDPSPGPGELRVRVQFSSVNPADYKVIQREFAGNILHGQQSPVVVGYDFSGVVDGLGAGVSGIGVGDAVFGHLPYTRDTKRGAFAEYLITKPEFLARRPEDLPANVAAALATGGCTALQMLRDLGKLEKGGSVLVIGAAGGVGSLAVGIAKAMGATVSAVCSTPTVALVEGLGADRVIDRKRDNPLMVPGSYDVIIDAAAAHDFASTRHLLTKRGAYVTTLPNMAFVTGKLLALFSAQRCEMIQVAPKTADLLQLATWVRSGMLVPIDSRHPVKSLGSAIRKQQEGGVSGKIVIAIERGF